MLVLLVAYYYSNQGLYLLQQDPTFLTRPIAMDLPSSSAPELPEALDVYLDDDIIKVGLEYVVLSF